MYTTQKTHSLNRTGLNLFFFFSWLYSALNQVPIHASTLACDVFWYFMIHNSPHYSVCIRLSTDKLVSVFEWILIKAISKPIFDISSFLLPHKSSQWRLMIPFNLNCSEYLFLAYDVKIMNPFILCRTKANVPFWLRIKIWN